MNLAIKIVETSISFLPALLGEKQESHEYLYWGFLEQVGEQAVRFGN